METDRARVLDKDHKIVFNVKGKKATKNAALRIGASHTALSQQFSSPSLFNKLRKRKRSDESNTKSRSNFRRSVLRNYTNLNKSGPPQRFLYNESGEWRDYPQEIVDLVREQFQLKNAAIEVDFNGRRLLLDILYMIQLELKTGLLKQIAWIDELGCCFFPEIHSSYLGKGKYCHSELQNNYPIVLKEPNEAQEVTLKLEIEITGLNSSDTEECVEESNSPAKRTKIEQKPLGSHDDLYVNDYHNQTSDSNMQEINKETQQFHENIMIESLVTLNSNSVRDLFNKGIGSFLSVSIKEIKQCSSHLMQGRYELFQKQVEITKKYRGNPNVQYGWMAVTKDAVSDIMQYGLGHGAPRMSSYGIGVHLASVNNAHISANYCDDDENGVRHLVLCRVILGNAEMVNQGSGQCHPSSIEFDSGVDNLQNPHHLIVWSMNMNTHIFPEYLVSFETFSKSEGDMATEGRVHLSGITTSDEHAVQLPFYGVPIESGIHSRTALENEKRMQEKPVDIDSSSSATPKSPWMPFTALFEAISKEVAPNDMKLVNVHFDLYKRKKINREGFIRNLRAIVGDALLKSTIMSLQCKLPPKSVLPMEVPKQEHEFDDAV